jgi:hypothetical protein
MSSAFCHGTSQDAKLMSPQSSLSPQAALSPCPASATEMPNPKPRELDAAMELMPRSLKPPGTANAEWFFDACIFWVMERIMS